MFKIPKLTLIHFAIIQHKRRFINFCIKSKENSTNTDVNRYEALDLIGRETIIRVQVCFVFQNEL